MSITKCIAKIFDPTFPIPEFSPQPCELKPFSQLLALRRGIILLDRYIQEVKRYFHVCDKGGKGWVDMDDFRTALKICREKLTKEELEDKFQRINLKGDGHITLEEFQKALTESLSSISIMNCDRL